MRLARSLLSLVIALSLAACFVQHAEPIGTAEPAESGQWSGFWVAEPLEAGGEPGFFAIADIDPAKGVFSVSDADPDGNPISEPIPLHLRRVGDTLFLNVQDEPGDPWMLFVVAENSEDHVVLAWKPRAEEMRQAIAAGSLQGELKLNAAAEVEELALTEFTDAQQAVLARDWRNLFNNERMVLRRVPAN